MDFMSSPSTNSINEVYNAYGVSTASTQSITTSTQGHSQKVQEDQGYVDSKCFRHMTSNMYHLSDFKEFDRGYVTFGGGANGGKITGKGSLKTSKLNFKDVYFVKELKFNHLSVSQMCDKKNSILFTDTGCFVLSSDFKLTDESQVLLKVPRRNNMDNVDMKNIVPKESLTCLVAKATLDESMLWYWRLVHINFKNINKLVKYNLVRVLPSKHFENDQTFVTCLKGKQHKASCESKVQNYISQPLLMLHLDLFGPTFVSSLMHKKYELVVTNDYNRYTWVFFLASKDETTGILKKFITKIKNLVNKKVKVIKCDYGTEFKNSVMNDFCAMKGIRREFSVARTPQQNGVAERRNRTLIKAARTMALVVKPHNKTPYELFRGRTPTLSFMRPFECYVTILNTLDHLSKFDGKADEGYFVGYSMNSKAFRLYNIRTKGVEENLHIRFLEDKPSIGDDPKIPGLETIATNNDSKEEADFTNLESLIHVSPIPTTRTHKNHPLKQVFKKKKDERGVVIKNKARVASEEKKDGIFISHDKYVAKVLRKFSFLDVKSANTLVDMEKTLVKDADGDDVDVHLYRSMIRSLMHLTTSRLNIMYAYPRDSPFELVAYTDSDYAGASLDSKSTTRGCQFLKSRLKTWQCKKKTVVSTSTTEAKYVAAASCCGQYGYFEEMIQYKLTTGLLCINMDPHEFPHVYLVITSVLVMNRGIIELMLLGKLTTAIDVNVVEEAKSKKSKKRITEVSQLSDSTHDVVDEHVTTISNDPLLSETTKANQALEIRSLNKRVKKLEKNARKKTHKHKRLYKIGSSTKVESSEDAGLDDQEDASKQGRMIEDLDADEGVSLVDETQGRNDQDMFDTSIFDDEEVVVEKKVSTANPVPTAGEVVTTTGVEVSTATITSQISMDEITLAKALMDIKTLKPKAKGIVIKEPNYELVARLHEEERGKLTIEEKSRLFVELMDKRKKHLARLRAEKIRKLVKGSEKAAEGSKKTAEGSSKRVVDKLEQKDAKRQRIEEENESAKLKRCLEIIPDNEDDVTIEDIPLSSKSPRLEDLGVLWSIIKKYQQGTSKVLNWKLFDLCGVYCVTTQNMVYYLLVEKMYPFTRNILHQMWNDVRLQVDYEVEMAYDLLRLIRRQISKGYVPE
nr:putative ribonuclease H-like domain-containing protein [Tanacetum cinerariifolium]